MPDWAHHPTGGGGWQTSERVCLGQQTETAVTQKAQNRRSGLAEGTRLGGQRVTERDLQLDERLLGAAGGDAHGGGRG